MVRQRFRRYRRNFLGERGREITLGWAVGSLYTIVVFTAAAEGLVPMVAAGLGGVLAALVATIPSSFRWGDGMGIGARAATLSAVTFALYFTAHLFYILYAFTGDYFLLVAPSYALVVGIGVAIAFVVTGAIAGLVVFKIKGWMVRNGVGNVQRHRIE